MSSVRFQNVTKRFDSKPVLREVFFRLSPGDRVGLIGRNGSGKTTVLRLILGREKPTGGEVILEPDVKIGYFSQFSELDSDVSVREVLHEVFAEVRAIEAELADTEGALQEPGLEDSRVDALLNRQGELIEAMDQRDGWTYQVRIDTVLGKLGFDHSYQHRPLHLLSAGWRNRASLARILLEQPDVLLLDEPTNYLDVAGLAWLETWLRKVRGALIVVSHDRHFLDQVVTRVVEIENYRFQEYQGSFTAYVREKRTRFRALQRQFKHEEELLAYEAEAIADRREAAKDPSGALRRRLANIKKMATPRPVDKVITRLYEGLYVGTKVCRAERISKSYDGNLLFGDLTLAVQRGERVAIVGPNGCGKTTLIKILTGVETPDSGQVVWERGVEWVDFNQVLAELDPDDTVTHAVNVVGLAYFAPRKQVNHFLSLMQFSELDLRQRIGTLSGGQKARIALAQCLLSGAAAIFLDEPTNHLDLPSIQVMERALVHFPGAIVMASHDRFFIDKVATRLLIFGAGGELQHVNGNWTIWQASGGEGTGVASQQAGA